jgi:autotransporter-associated beta strand protein
MPAFPAGIRIIFQGDEITAGDHWTPAQWPTPEYNHNFGQDYVCLIASRYGMLYPQDQDVFLNEGVSGNTVADLAARWQTDTIDNNPGLLSILIGANDSESIADFSQKYDQLLAQTVAALPNVHLFLCEPFMLPSPDSAMAARIAVVDQLAVKYNATVVHLQQAFLDAFNRYGNAAYWLYDGVHPSAAGEQILADEWMRGAVAFYNQRTDVPITPGFGELPAFPAGKRILFQGDSITDGRANGSSQFGQCYPYFIAAKYSALHPEGNVTFINHGVSGNTVETMAARWQTDTIDVHPDLLSIFIGVNDGNNITGLAQNYDQLLANTIAALPNTQIILCEMISRPFYDPAGTTIWTARAQLIAQLSAKYHLPVAHFQQAMNDAYQRYSGSAYWIWDGVHPTAFGQQILADEWNRAVTAFYASQQQWDGAVNLNWDTAMANWSGSAWTNGNNALFSGTGIGTVNLGTGVIANSLTFNHDGYTLTGGTLALGVCIGSPCVTVNSQSATIGAPLDGFQGLTKSGPGTLILTGINTYTGDTTISGGTLQLGDGTSGHDGSLVSSSYVNGALTSSNIVNNATLIFDLFAFRDFFSVISGTGTLMKSGSAELDFDVANSYTGQTIVNGGTLRLNGTSASFGSNSAVTLANVSGAALQSLYWNGSAAVGSSFSIGSLAGGGAKGGNVLLGATATMTVGTDNTSTTYRGCISDQFGPANVTKVGTGIWTLTGNNIYTGMTTVTAGKIVLSGTIANTSSASIAAGAQATVSGKLYATGTIVNSGTLIFTGSAQFGAGGTITNNGVIINSSPSLTLPTIVNNGTIYTRPAAPTGIVATPGNTQVSLTWNAVSGAASYNVKRSSVSGSNYTIIAANTAATSYSDSSVTNWTTFYYVVSALNPSGEGPNSIQAAATPHSPVISRAEQSESMKLTLSGSNTAVTFSASVIGHTYQLQYVDSLTSGTWTNYGTALPGTGGNLNFSAPYDSSVPRRFYRLQIRQ